MTRWQVRGMLLTAALGVAILVFLRMRRPPSSPIPHEAQVADAVPVPREPVSALPAPVSEGSARRQLQRQHAMQLAWQRDPFTLSPAATVRQVSDLTLSGILWDLTDPIAIVNGQMVRVGEDYEGYHILAISEDRITFTDGTHTSHLRLE